MNIYKTVLAKLITVKIWMSKASLKKKLAFLAVALVLGWFGGTRLLDQTQQVPTYQTTQVVKGTLVTAVTASGTVSEGNSASITTQATGIVSEVYVKDGDLVTTGQAIATLKLDVASQQKQMAALASYQQATNSIASAKNTLNSLQSSLFSANQEFINDAVARDLTVDDPTYIQQNADWLAAEGSYKNQQAVIAATRTSASSSWLTYVQLSPTITAPTSGIVSGLTLTPGLPIIGTSSLGTITLEQGTPQVSVNLTEIDVVKVKVGQKVTLTLDALPDMTFTGKVVSINTNGSVSSGVTTYPITIAFDTAVTSIYPNMAVNATIITDIKNNIVLVPSGAVQTSNGETSLRIMREGKVASVLVEAGDSNDTQTEIISGISEGDIIVTSQTSTTTTGIGGTGVTSPFGNTRGGSGSTGGFGGQGGGMIRR